MKALTEKDIMKANIHEGGTITSDCIIVEDVLSALELAKKKIKRVWRGHDDDTKFVCDILDECFQIEEK